jgi:potassium efflux system protein
MISNALRWFVAFLILAGSLAMPASAQTTDRAGSPIIDEQRGVLSSLSSRTEILEKRIADAADDDARLLEIRLELEDMGRELLRAGVAFRPRLTEINTRLEVLGSPPAEGQPPEPELVTREREALMAEKAEINAAVGVAEDLSVRVNNLVNQITEMRRELFSRLLTRRYDISFKLMGEVAKAASEVSDTVTRSVSAWLRFVVNFKLGSVLAATLLALAAAAVLLVGGRRLVGGLFVADPEVQEPTSISRLSVAFWSTLLPSLAFGVFLAATYFFYDYFEILRGDIRVMLFALFAVIGLFFFVHRLGYAVLSPRLAEWRLIPVRSAAANRLLWIMSGMAALTGLDYLLSKIYETVNAPLSLTVGEALIATVLIGLLMIWASFVKPFTDEAGNPRPWPLAVRIPLFLIGAATVVAALLGYVGLSRFVSQQVVLTGAVLVTMYIGFLSAQAVAEEGAFASTKFGQRLQRRLHLDDTTMDQLSLVISIVINILVLIVGLPLILYQWGFQPGDILAWFYRFASGVQIGSITVSLTGIFWGLVVFVIGFFVTRWFQGWLDGSVMARGKVDAGVRNSIRTVVGYAGIALAVLVGFSAAGIDFSSLALIAGGLSLGIGFGLQNIVSNFVSGLILLAERPFKSGDWIVAGSVSGTVKKISVRATEIETFQRQTVILPNSELINGAVGNWTHRNKMGRIEIPVGVAYGSDARKVQRVLTEVAMSHPLVLKNPEPFVQFTAFGDSALNFEIRVYLADIGTGGVVQNDLRFAILEAFERENIEMPFPQLQIRVGDESKQRFAPIDDDRAIAELEEAHRMREEAKQRQPPRGRRRKGPDPA